MPRFFPVPVGGPRAVAVAGDGGCDGALQRSGVRRREPFEVPEHVLSHKGRTSPGVIEFAEPEKYR